MKVAYWPGCVSRGFTPELHGSMAKVAPLLDIELIELDRAANAKPGPSGCITAKRSRVAAWVLRTDEELMIARHTQRALGQTQRKEKKPLAAAA